MRKIIYDNIHKITALLTVMAICVMVVLGGMFGTTAAYGESYTDVLTDLQADESFNTADYPADSEDYSLSVIQVAESTDGELFIYVYQPSFALTPLTATQISMSLYEWHTTDESTGNSNASYNLYDLTLVSKKGVFQKYRVDSFTVSGDDTRYYDIAAIYRDFNADIDEETDDDNTTDSIAFEVGKCWAASTDESGNVTYEVQETEVIEITDMHVGFIRYENDFSSWDFTSTYVDSHYIAFSTDWDIDTLYEIDISFYTVYNVFSAVYTIGDQDITEYSVPDYTYYDSPLTLTYEDKLSIDVTGVLWFHKEYTWDRLQTASGFISDETDNLTDDTITAISNMQYVVRFYESEYEIQTTNTDIYSTVYREWIDVEEVRILRLKFEADGKTYNLGVVSNAQTGDTTPDGTDEYDTGDLMDDIEAWWESVKTWFSDLSSTVTTVLRVVFAVVFGLLALWVISWIVKLVKALFNSIKRIFKKDKKE